MSSLKKGDTIQCRDEADMLETHYQLQRAGVFTDWNDIEEEPPLKYRLTVLGVVE